MEFHRQAGEILKAETVPRYWPSRPVEKEGEFVQSVVRAKSPEGAATGQIVIRSWSSPGAAADFDNFAISEIPE